MRSTVQILSGDLLLSLLFPNVLQASILQVRWSRIARRKELMLPLSQESAFSGEILWFRVYCTSRFFRLWRMSQLAFVELVSLKIPPVIRKKILLDHGRVRGIEYST